MMYVQYTCLVVTEKPLHELVFDSWELIKNGISS